MGGPVARAFEQLRVPADRYQATGIVAGILTANTITTLDGEVFPAEPAPALRRWMEKHPDAAGRPSRWIVYPRTLEGGLAFYVVGQRQALTGETEAQLNRQVDRFQITGVLMNSRGQRRQTCIRICRNRPTPKAQRRHPNWKVRLLFLSGLPPAPTKNWWNSDVRIQAQRIGREIKILAMEKVGDAAIHRELMVGPATLPWPWKPSSQAIWRLCQREGLAGVSPWPCSEAEADTIRRRYLAVSTALLTDIAPAALGRQAERADPKKRAELAALGQHHLDLLRQWLARTNQFFASLPASEAQGIATANQLKQRLATAMVADLSGVFAQEGERFWLEGWPIRGGAARVLRENLPLAPTGTLEVEVAQEAKPVPEAPKPKSTPSKKAPTADEVIEAVMAQAQAQGWSEQLLHLRITAAISELLS